MAQPHNFPRAAIVLLVLSLLATACPAGGSDDNAADETNRNSSTATETTLSSADPTPGSEAQDPLADLPPTVVPDPDQTPLEPDSNIRIGTLDNGLTYYVKQNDSPGSSLDLRLAVNAGSLQQEVPDSGLAHFVEHMLFNGTAKYPANQMDRVLQGFGLEFGPDVNAYTSYDETVYQLSLQANNQAVEAAFDVIHEWASAATIDEQQIIAERGVVREERRLRTESPGGVVHQTFDAAYVAGSAYEGYQVIGTADNILATEESAARRFYDRWYRPGMMAVIAVGDLPADRLEQEIIDRFGSLADRSDAPERSDPVIAPIDSQLIEVVINPETTRPFVSLDYWVPAWDGSTVGGQRLQLLDSIVTMIIANRLSDGVERGEIRAVDPSVTPFAYTRKLAFLGFNFGGSDLAAATEDVLSEMTRMQISGFTEDELARVITQMQGQFDQEFEQSRAAQDSQLASQYAQHFLAGGDISSARSRYDRISGVLAEVSAQAATEHFRYLMSVSAPLIVVVGPETQAVPSVAEIQAAVDAAVNPALTEAGVIDSIEQLMERPTPVAEISRTSIDEVFGFEMEFANGARGLFAPSEVDPGRVRIWASSNGGWSLLEEGDGPLAELAAQAVGRSGLGEIGPVQLRQFLAGSVVDVRPYIDETTEGFSGSAGSDETETAFQLLHLLVTEPRVDPGGFASAIEDGEIRQRAAQVDPATKSRAEMLAARYGSSDFIMVAPDQDRLSKFSAAEALRLYEARLDDVDDLVVAVTGDIDSKLVEDYFRSYIGTLPSGEPDTFRDLWPEPPEGIIKRQVDAGLSDAGAGIDMLFSVPMDLDHEVSLQAEVVGQILQSRLLDSIREDLGASYGATVLVSSYRQPDEVVDVFVSINGDPDRLALIEESILAEIADLTSGGLTAEEFERAKAVVADEYGYFSNDTMLEMLQNLARDGGSNPLTRIEEWETVSLMSHSSVRSMATKLFPADRRIQIERS